MDDAPSPLIPDCETRVGCASWLDQSLIASRAFYPRASMSAEERLRWYAEFFPFVEANSTYYSLLTPETAAAWAERTPPGFQFGVKAWAPMTGHRVAPGCVPPAFRPALAGAARTARGDIPAEAFPEEARDRAFELFGRALRPLAESGRLGYALFQFAPWFSYGEKTLAYVRSLPRRLPKVPLAVEFRNASWVPRRTGESLALLREAGLAHVAVDCPWMPCVPESTSPVFVLRCHGQNEAGWKAQMRGESPTVAEKYDFLYDDKQLRGLTDRLKTVRGKPRKIFLVFNNNKDDYPVSNALTASRQLGFAPPDPVRLKEAWLRNKRPQREFGF